MESVEADTSSAAEQKRTYDTAFLRGRGLWVGEYPMVGTGYREHLEVQCRMAESAHPVPPPRTHLCPWKVRSGTAVCRMSYR